MDEVKQLTVKDVMAARHSSNFHDVLLAYLEQMEATVTHRMEQFEQLPSAPLNSTPGEVLKNE